ncbi:MAG: winged helix-turn-helix domain-containing protein [bacterium]|nr:winged helix-turn-helix domain-containing protein [bacterium]
MPDLNINPTTNNYRRLERVVKGFANHRRLEILHLLHKSPELSVEDISEILDIGYENASDHLRKMAIAGLILKRNEGNNVRHKLTTRAESILVFCKTLE